jgi:hypothetical protein
MSPRSTVHELTITLLGVEPPVWRRVQVPSGATLSRVHGDIQAVMGWSNSHLHQFEIGDIRYGSPDHDDLSEWIGGRWDPELFNLDAANEALKMSAAGRFR